MTLRQPRDINTLIQDLVARIQPVAGLEAIVLGGSRARGTHRTGSDIDLCIYYNPQHPLDIRHLGQVAAEVDDEHRPNLLTPIGGWGPWINGGGWLTVGSQPVDFLYRDLQRVRSVMTACRAGQVEVVYQPGHPHAFVSSICLSEVALCKILWDPSGALANLKLETQPYPPALKQATIERFRWEITFAIQNGHKAAQRGDVAYVAGCCFRSVACLLQTLFALNEQYWLNEKGALELAAGFARRPERLQERVETVFSRLAANTSSIVAALAELEALDHELGALST